MRSFILLLLSFFLSFVSFAQKNWHFSDSTFLYVLHLKTITVDEGRSVLRSVESIEIYTKNSNKKIQTLYPESQDLESFLDSTMVFKIEDVNFDGNKDIRLLSGTTTNLQTSYFYWFFDKTANKFVSNTTLQNLMNPSFNAKAKTIHTWWRYGFTDFGHAIYKWNNNKISLIIEEVEIHEDNINLNKGYVVTKRHINENIITNKRKASKDIIDYMCNGECKLH